MKKFTTEEIRDLFNRVMREEISFSEMVEIINERVSEVGKPCVKDIPVRKFKKGDKVRIKKGVSSKTHRYVSPNFTESMNKFIGKELIVKEYSNSDFVVLFGDHLEYHFNEDWLEPYEELEKGDLAIFWDFNKESAFIGKYSGIVGNGSSFPHQDHRGNVWVNAIKFESADQYKRFIKGEI